MHVCTDNFHLQTAQSTFLFCIIHFCFALLLRKRRLTKLHIGNKNLTPVQTSFWSPADGGNAPSNQSLVSLKQDPQKQEHKTKGP